MFPSGYDDYYQGVTLDTEEKTPEMHAPVVEQEVKPSSGIYRNCYLCGVDVARLPETSVASMLYERIRTKEEIRVKTPAVKYVITYCSPCYRSHLHTFYK